MRPLSLALLVLGPALLVGCGEQRPSFEPEKVNAAPLGKGLPRGFLLGTSTASQQGGSGTAPDAWNHFDEDVTRMKRLGSNAYGFSVEWSRLEPAPGQWDAESAARYRQWAQALRAQGLEPLVTLHPSPLPAWVAASGGWEDPATLASFERFAGRVADLLGGEVDWWCTVHEPNVSPARVARQLRTHDMVDADGDGKATLVGLSHPVSTPDLAGAGVAGSLDFLGLNDSEPSAEGLYLILKRSAALGLPLVLMESGLEDRTGERRPSFLKNHLYAVEQAVAAGVDVRGYFPRFGLFRVDRSTPELERQGTPAVETFREAARNLGLTPTP
ncbi:family 1 glycosylhydrolase [Archangium sp.]|uniref:family 1 glycosylhydrolase n=1 Tax=Archangium sp. TaxID=1872627 RepID=UPI00286D3BBB|nr:family 1 glycosylhydrolase [Archangium sp.]